MWGETYRQPHPAGFQEGGETSMVNPGDTWRSPSQPAPDNPLTRGNRQRTDAWSQRDTCHTHFHRGMGFPRKLQWCTEPSVQGGKLSAHRAADRPAHLVSDCAPGRRGPRQIGTSIPEPALQTVRPSAFLCVPTFSRPAHRLLAPCVTMVNVHGPESAGLGRKRVRASTLSIRRGGEPLFR